MTRDELLDLLNEFYCEDHTLTVFDGFEDAVVGVARQFTGRPLVVYDRDKCIEVLVEQGMDHDEAEEYFQFNTEGCWAGDSTPLIMVSIETLKDMS